MAVLHNSELRKFSFPLPDGEEAYLRYELDSRSLNISTTFVPTSARGRGLGKELVQAACDFAREQNLQLTSTCWYASRVLAGD